MDKLIPAFTLPIILATAGSELLQPLASRTRQRVSVNLRDKKFMNKRSVNRISRDIPLTMLMKSCGSSGTTKCMDCKN